MVDDEIKPVVWVGDSRQQVQGFPAEVRKDIGSSLYDAQKGDTPDAAKQDIELIRRRYIRALEMEEELNT